MVRKLLAGILAISILFGTNSMAALANTQNQESNQLKEETGYKKLPDYGIPYGDFLYYLWGSNREKAIICGYTGTSASIVIPDKIDGSQVTEIDSSAFKDCTSLENIELPESVEKIGLNAFYGCINLKTINLPKSLTMIEGHAFRECSSLKNMEIPDSVTNIEGGIFYDCTGLQTVHLPNGIERIESFMFSGCENLTEFQIPESVTSIGESAFQGCANISAIHLPESMTCIEPYTFNGCENLTEFQIPESVTSIGKFAFSRCRNITAIHLPDGITCIEAGTFNGCDRLSQINLPDGLTDIGERAFSDCGLENIIFPDGLINIGKEAFYQCHELKKIQIPNNVKYIGESAFERCYYLTEIKLPEVMDAIGPGAFKGCSNLDAVHLPNGITAIENNLFSGCNKLTELSIPENVISIGENAFNYCGKLEKIIISSGVNTIDPHAFTNCDRLTIFGYLNTYAESYAKENNINFRDIEESYIVGAVESIDIVNRTVAIMGQTYPVLDNFDFDELNGIIQSEDSDVILTVKNNSIIKAERVSDTLQMNISMSIASKPGIYYKDKRYWDVSQDVKVVTEVCSTYPTFAFDNAVGAGIYADKMTCNVIEEGLCVSYAQEGQMESKESVKEIGKKLSPGTILVDYCYVYPRKGFIVPYAVMPYSVNVSIETENGAVTQSIIINAYNHDIKGEQDANLSQAREELQNLCKEDLLSLSQDMKNYLSDDQLNAMSSYLFTWMAEISHAYTFSGDSELKKSMLYRLGVASGSDFVLGTSKAVTHLQAETPYGMKTVAVTLNLEAAANGNRLTFGDMEYEVIEKDGIPGGVPTKGRFGMTSYDPMEPFRESVIKAMDYSINNTYQLSRRKDDILVNFYIDKITMDVVGAGMGSYSDNLYTLYKKTIQDTSKKITVECPVNVFVYDLDGNICGSVVDNETNQINADIGMEVAGDTKIFHLPGNDYYIELEGTDSGTMTYTIEELTQDQNCVRTVQFANLPLENRKLYTGYILEPLYIDGRLYSLQTADQVVYADTDTYQSAFIKVERIEIRQDSIPLDPGKTLQLNAYVYPENASNKNLWWSSDNESVAVVDNNGLIRTVGAGQAVITAESQDGSGAKASCVVTVRKADDPPVPTEPTMSTAPVRPSVPVSPDVPFIPIIPTSPTKPSGPTDSANPTEPSKPEDDDLVIELLYYIVEFDANGGTKLSRQTMTLLNDDSLGILPKIEYRNYIFKGWFTRKDGGEKVSESTVLNAATTLYAQWEDAKPKKAGAPALKSKKNRQLIVSFKKVTGADGYEIAYSQKKKCPSSSAKKVTTEFTKKTLKNLKTGKKYYVKLRAYRIDSTGKKVYGAYSKVKSMKVK